MYKTASEVLGQGGLGVAALLGPQAVPCALLELYDCKQSKKRSLEEGKHKCRANIPVGNSTHSTQLL